jgi:glutathione S-transferase
MKVTTMEQLTLFVDANYDSPWAMSAFVALEEKGIPYELKPVKLSAKETFDAAYGALTKRVPALKHGDFWLAESTAIQEYLAETFPFPTYPKIYPPEGKERARCRELQHWMRSDLLPLRQERPTTTIWFESTLIPLSPQAKAAAEKFVLAVERLIDETRENIFDAWCVADVDVALMLQRLNLNGYPLAAKLKSYATRQWKRPSVAKWNALPRAAMPI